MSEPAETPQWISEDIRARIRANAALTIEKLSELRGEAFCYDLASVTFLEGYLERLRQSDLAETTRDNLVSVLGSYLGEALLDQAAGAWVETEFGPAVRFANGAQAFPLSKIRKLFDNGLEAGDSIASFYAVAIEQVATGALSQS